VHLTVREPEAELKLTNGGKLAVFPVGTGSAFTKKNYQNNYILIKGNEHIMVDCGTRTPEALAKLGRPVTEIENFIITHSHADHIGGLEEVILMGRYVTKKKPNIIITKEYEKLLWNDSLKGGAAWNESKANRFLTFGDYWTIHRPKRIRALNREAWEIDYKGFNIILFRTMHYPDNAPDWRRSAYSTGLIVDRRFLFTGDTRFDREMIEDINAKFPIEVIFHDVQFFPGGVHAFFDDLCTLPDEIRAKTWLMHYPDNFETFTDRIIERGFPGFVRQQMIYEF
jgi:ribonuclease BN (tRNA processing enzyme)